MQNSLMRTFIIAIVCIGPLLGIAVAAGAQQHIVQKGETLSEIAQTYQVPLKSIIQANGIKSMDYIQSGKMLRIPRKAFELQEIWYQVKPGDTLISIARRHNVEWKDLQQINGISAPRHLRAGTEIRIPHEGSLEFCNPLRIPLIVTSKYGYRSHPVTGRYQFHRGIDFRAATGTRVYATKAGKIIFAGWKKGYGKIVGIEHANDLTTWYGHLSRIRVQTGQIVALGKIIGLSGNTGISTGPHLHFEVRYKGRSEQPTKYIHIP